MNRLAVWHRRVQRGALWMCCRILGRSGCCALFGLAVYVCAPWIPQAWLTGLLWTAVALLSLALCTSEPTKAGSTLAQSVVFSYRRARIHRKLAGWFIHADIKKKPNTEIQVARHGSPAHEVTPKIAKRYTRMTPCGLSVVVKNNIGYDDIDIAGKAHSVCSSAGARDLFVERCEDLSHWDRLVNLLPDGSRTKEHWTQLAFVYRDLFKRTVTTSMLPPATERDRLMVALDERWRGVELSHWLSQFIAGTSGSGKSVLVWRQLLGMVLAGKPFLVLVYNPKEQEFGRLKDAAYVYETNNFERFMERSIKVLLDRQAKLAALGEEDCPEDDRFPTLFFIIDEMVEAVAGMTKNERAVKVGGKSFTAEGALQKVVSTARANNGFVAACSVEVRKEVIKMRPMFPNKIMMRMMDVDATRIMAGGGKDIERRYPAHLIPIGKKHAGICWIDTGDGKGLRKCRVAWVTKAERILVTERVAELTARYRDDATPVSLGVRESVSA